MMSLLLFCIGAVNWQHPAGMDTAENIAEVRAKVESLEWAQRLYAAKKAGLSEWINRPYADLKRVFPVKRGNVYHNFSCPADRNRLRFDPFQPEVFQCPICGKTYPSGTDAGIYEIKDWYHGTMYDGWACIFYQTAGSVAADLALMAEVDGNDLYRKRAIEILLLFADTLDRVPTEFNENRQFSRIFTYHREGDNKILFDLARAFELLRGRLTPEECARVTQNVLNRMLNDIMLEPIYTYDHNNVYQWHRTILQTALALEREDLIDWSFGYGAFDPEYQPEHRSLRRIIATHFKPDGAFWELCSGYHLYPMYHFCELAVLSHHLSRMDPARFPPREYDLTSRASAGGETIRKALEWFMAMAMPDRTMPTIGDSTVPRAGMDAYSATAEVGYRFFDVREVGDYAALRNGARSWDALLYGAPAITQRFTPFTSSYLSSGWVSLRNQWHGNDVWVGLNALIPGGGHQHADRLTLLTYSHGKLLALEKATPYNENVTRELGTLSQSHNTVTVDAVSQKQGEALSKEETPEVAYFFAGPVAKFAELRGDYLYAQAKTYRRAVALIEDIVVDLFRVEGGAQHDWMVNHAGSAPTISVAMQGGTFAPQEWLANGSAKVLSAATDNAWQAEWRVDDVTSRLTMMGAVGTGVYALETYPVDNAIVTPKNTPCQTLCVRRRNDAPYLAVWDAWRETPNLQNVAPGSVPGSLAVKTAANTYYLLFGPGEARFEDGLTLKSDAAFSVLRNHDAITFVDGAYLEVRSAEGTLRVSADQNATVCAEWDKGVVTVETAGSIHYDTYGGQDHYRDAPGVIVTVEGKLWRVKKSRLRFAGHVE